jgi:hypothetical protein
MIACFLTLKLEPANAAPIDGDRIFWNGYLDL